MAGSGGDLMPWMFKHRKIGLLVGNGALYCALTSLQCLAGTRPLRSAIAAKQYGLAG
jgi:hypothetical protein